MYNRLQNQMVNGCSRDICINVHCKNNPNFKFKGASEVELKREQEKVWAEFTEEKKHKLFEICCHTEFMKDTIC